MWFEAHQWRWAIQIIRNITSYHLKSVYIFWCAHKWYNTVWTWPTSDRGRKYVNCWKISLILKIFKLIEMIRKCKWQQTFKGIITITIFYSLQYTELKCQVEASHHCTSCGYRPLNSEHQMTSSRDRGKNTCHRTPCVSKEESHF